MSENVYDKARAVLKERGRTLGELDQGELGVCLVGAVAIAAGEELTGHVYHLPALEPVQRFILEQFPDSAAARFARSHPGNDTPPGEFCWRFNDDEAVTDADVDLVLDKAARAFDEQVQS